MTDSLIIEVTSWEDLGKKWNEKKKSYFRAVPDCPQIRKMNHKQKQKNKNKHKAANLVLV